MNDSGMDSVRNCWEKFAHVLTASNVIPNRYRSHREQRGLVWFNGFRSSSIFESSRIASKFWQLFTDEESHKSGVPDSIDAER
jgi:hypothetical protein